MSTPTLSWKEWAALDATAMAALVRKGEVTPRELSQQCAHAIEQLNPQLNAVIEVFDDAVEAPSQMGDGPFHGVPLPMKDALSGMAGRKSEWGAVFMRGHTKTQDDPLTVNFRAAGFNLMARTTLPTMGCANITDSLAQGITRNPWNLERTPGASSGGASALIAAGINPIASASDGGGSIRGPACFTGLIGLKCSRGRLPLPYGFNELTAGIAAEGVLTRTVRDTAAVFDAIAKHTPGGRYMPIPDPVEPYLSAIERAPRPLRIAMTIDNGGRGGEAPSAEVVQAIRDTAKRLEALGHHIEEIDSHIICDWQTLWSSAEVSWAGGSQAWSHFAAMAGSTISEDNCESLMWQLFQYGKKFGLDDFQAAAAGNEVYTRQFGQFFQKYDLWLSPSEFELAPLCGPETSLSPLYPASCPADGERFINELIDSARFMMPANEAGFPSICVPASIDKNGVPYGALLSTTWCGEDVLLQVAAQLESAYPELFNQPAPLHVTSL